MKHNSNIREKDGGLQAIITYKYDGELKWRTKAKQGFQKHRDAKRWITEMVVQLADNEGRYSPSADMLLGHAVDLYLTSKSCLAANSYITYKNAMAQFKDFHDIKLADLNPITTQKIAATISPGFVKYLRMFWRYMDKMDLISQNYLEIKTTEKKKKFKIIKDEDYQKILFCKNVSLEVKVFCQIAYRFGMRTGEILGLTPEHVKKDRLIITQQWARISKDDINMYGMKILKNGDLGYRELPSTPDIQKMLNSLPFNFKDGRYFTFNKSDTVNNNLKKLKINHTAHDFRHTRASEMVHNGFNLKYVAYFLGDTLDTIIKTYVDLSEEMKKQEEEKFLTYFCRQ